MVSSSSKTATALPPRPEDYPPGSVLLTTWIAVVIISAWVVTWSMQVALSLTVGLTMTKTRLQYWNGHIFRYVTACAPARLCPGVNVKVTASSWKPTAEYVSGEKACLVACNHRSYFDPFALGTALYPLESKYVAKGDLFSVPFGGWAMGRAGDLAVKYDPKKNAGWGVVKGATGQLLLAASEQLLAGNSVAIFPEGTRMGYCADRVAEAAKHESKLMPFKAPFFDLARKTKCGVVCVAMKGADEVWPLGSSLMRPATVYVAIGEPLFGSDFEDEFKFAEAVRMKVGTMYQQLCKEYP